MTAFVTFVSPVALRQDSEQLIQEVEAKLKKSQTEPLIRIMSTFTNEVLQVFFVNMVELMGLSPFMTKMVHGTVSTIEKSAHGISTTIIRKLDHEQIAALATHIGTTMLNATDAAGNEQHLVGFPISDELHARLKQVVKGVHGDDPRAQIPEFIEVMLAITDAAVDTYVGQATRVLNLGFVLRKLSDGGNSIIQGAAHMVIRKLGPDLEADQLVSLADYMDKLIVENPGRYRPA